MAHGGARPNAGRKPGQTTKLNEEAREQALDGGISPLDYMLKLLRDEEQPQDMRFEAAKAAAPYVHARLANVDAKLSGKDGGAITFTWLPPQEG